MPRALFKALVTATLTCSAGAALAATCGNDASGFDTWKREFAAEAQQAGVGQRGIDALMRAPYSTSTIRADRNQKGVKYALNEFIRIRLGSVDGFAATAQKRLNGNPNLYRGLEQTYGVPAGILLAIHGMETGFGRTMGDTPVVSSISTVAYDCRRSDFFTPHALAALQMVDRGMLAPDQRGAAHGELGHTQFLLQRGRRAGLHREFPARQGLAARAALLGRNRQFPRSERMECRNRLPAGHRAGGRAHPLSHAAGASRQSRRKAPARDDLRLNSITFAGHPEHDPSQEDDIWLRGTIPMPG